MLKKVLETIGTRYLVAFLNLLLIFINGRVLGVKGMGLVGVIYASANIVVIFNSVLCGNTIVYFMNRLPFRIVFWPAYLWAFIGSAVACGVMALLGLFPLEYGGIVYVLSVLLSLVSVNSRFLLGKDCIKSFNAVFMIQGGMLFFILLGFYFGLGWKDAYAYLNGMMLSNFLALIVSLCLMHKPFFSVREKSTEPILWRKSLKEMLIYGLWSSSDNLAEGLTTRLNYFLLQRFGGYGQVGLLDSGTKISESMWHISNSVSFIAYSQVAKSTQAEEQRCVTLRLFKLTYCALALVMGIVLFVPEWVYTDYLFTPEFVGIRQVIIGLSVGIVALGSNHILCHYFIGTGRVRISAYCSAIGLLVLVVTGYFLIPRYGVFGSALSSSIAFVSMLIFSIIVFVRVTNSRLRELLPWTAPVMFSKKVSSTKFRD